MRGNDTHPRAGRRITDHRSEATDRFEHRILKDGLHDDIVEDAQLAQFEDAVATIENVRDTRREDFDGDGDPGEAIADAVEQLHEPIADRVDELCAERCRTVLVDGDEWVEEGWEDPEDVEEAKREATSWLTHHGDVARRLWDEDEDPVLNEVGA
ncbi:hypothetical protein Hbl1158_10250 [Halobaculum sp. CBA1158]|uniref:hypothetical protein n=1 Tax=Halobaculum sp. CBA1158 TaxID=2904243 RepID=UPI001F3BF823|nr:hypothetical protein [Halobaculum sp. CBA1158]UIO98915.1 hypothetical protein Hbl1158_10250 [Halobaculum sp. CBA1158]